MWRIDKATGRFVAYVFDNFQGHRLFYGDGWKDGKLVLTRGGKNSTGTRGYERFVYEKLETGQFRITYQVSADSLTWMEGDHLLFHRSQGGVGR